MSWTTASATGVLLDVPALGGVAENVLTCLARFTVPACDNAKLFDGAQHGKLQDKVCRHVADFGRCPYDGTCEGGRVYRYYCRAPVKHRICDECWIKPAQCGFDCGNGLCPVCTFETVVCTSCDERLPYCNKASCATDVYECCVAMEDKALCDYCSENREPCARCMKTLCDECMSNCYVSCDSRGCRNKQRLCSGCEGNSFTPWFACECGRVECEDHQTTNACVTCDRTLCSACTECESCTTTRHRDEKSRTAALVHATALTPAAPLVPAPAPTTRRSTRKRKAVSK